MGILGGLFGGAIGTISGNVAAIADMIAKWWGLDIKKLLLWAVAGLTAFVSGPLMLQVVGWIWVAVLAALGELLQAAYLLEVDGVPVGNYIAMAVDWLWALVHLLNKWVNMGYVAGAIEAAIMIWLFVEIQIISARLGFWFLKLVLRVFSLGRVPL